MLLTSLIEVLWDTAQKLNMSHKTSLPPINGWGTKLPNGTWTGLLGQIQRNECDVTFSFFSPTSQRNEVAEPSHVLWYEDYIIVGGFSKDSVHQTSIASSFSVFGAEVRIA
ncbi:hypothetical protein HPB50_020803 [Hyalomma asiaticum]|uniref:Uncharacterized protein n=1 Tax=Hyalomma asiaticum TaxID=266040 RepID=A0ACB7S6U0_HYAAI|nr:hypothetical protein HPB50_020803 [Hyalomma asiaticum]